MTVQRISGHAVSRFRKRVEPMPYDDVIAQLDSPAVRLAIDMGACGVKLPSGHRAIISNGVVVTVLPKPNKRATGKHVRGRKA